ncbi:DNA-binding transcriptional regulator, GntR family [Chitinophaga terrae (ex Kim and Jung 2007)]|jgi:DNA-binding GntR family transcriptional regulator|uniref:DNA-binding transcriptional regulator, GntR family n=1 Tax=Chitinophaga terrae (ex Kim and Jung 2007) TaxID=408074 RepID=A0A1H4D6E6_9BACT|nr:GntR family transcriptional regulator [Chitinophaga terrae (ex Kim and Jung 2007)]MDQ0108357.1 DNA-binding GntR family transcriptional regulator [Chitinophaga terrae (ex Kim and Jung 2007)]GEP90532.1 GntR family transcriptional regulator [Chitinophaga terrae (ex Kim and Jung 2007)]SEA67999.1 DNA-binding transcriptional regulator, GntR family [Chitinophaga terrae (ex Kim and Jung 2007)]
MKTDSLANKVYVELRRKILANQLVPGMRLKEDVWAKKMEVSRMAVREALTRLLGENLVVFGEKGGYFVKTMNAEDIKQIRQLRELLELGAIRLAIQHCTDEHISALERICEDFSNMVKNGYLGGACEADVKFHETLVASAVNPKLMELYQFSNIPLFHMKLGKMLQMDDYEQTDEEHRQIVNALKARDLRMAEEALIKHLVRGELTTLEID